jgi:hypothetical protein
MATIEILKKLGLTEKQAQVYTCVLEQGKSTYTTIAKLTDLNRTTVYSVAQELQTKRLVTEDLAGPIAYLVAAPLEDLELLLIEEQRSLELKKRWLQEAVRELTPLQNKAGYQAPKIQFIEEKNLSTYLHKRTPLWNQSLLEYDGTWWGFNDPSVIKYYQTWIDWYWKHHAPPGIHVKLISNESPIETEMRTRGYERRQIKFWDKSHNFSGSIWVIGDYTVLVNTQHRPHSLVEIHDKTWAHNLREMFKGLWEEIK